jgi:hypothetical protein
MNVRTHTKAEELTAKIAIWAVPQSEYSAETGGYKYSGEWKYELHGPGEMCYTTGAVKVLVQDVTVLIPGNINLVEKAVETVQEEINAEHASHQRRLTDLYTKMGSLRLLTHGPSDEYAYDPGMIEGETVAEAEPPKPESDDIPF